jgi:hypothetical protein
MHTSASGFIEPCLPMISRTVPTGADWAYEIKHDGFRFICRREGERVRCYSRGGHDWSSSLPAVVEAMRALPVTSVTLDGELVICGSDGVSQFDRMSTVFGRNGSREAFLYAFDVLELDGQDLRGEQWDDRRALLAQLLTGADAGIRLCEHIEGTDGAVVFRAACNMGLEGIVAKRRDSRYRPGRRREWIKVKNPAHPAIERAMLIALSKRQRKRGDGTWSGRRLRAMTARRLGVVLSSAILTGCASWFPSNSAPPIASWSGKHSIDDAVDCVKRALDYNFRSARSPIPDITHHVDTVEQGRAYDVSPPVGPYHVRVKSNGPETTTIELFMPGTMYSIPLRDSLAKCP